LSLAAAGGAPHSLWTTHDHWAHFAVAPESGTLMAMHEAGVADHVAPSSLTGE
jgi:hypothetical protein